MWLEVEPSSFYRRGGVLYREAFPHPQEKGEEEKGGVLWTLGNGKIGRGETLSLVGKKGTRRRASAAEGRADPVPPRRKRRRGNPSLLHHRKK